LENRLKRKKERLENIRQNKNFKRKNDKLTKMPRPERPEEPPKEEKIETLVYASLKKYIKHKTVRFFTKSHASEEWNEDKTKKRKISSLVPKTSKNTKQLKKNTKLTSISTRESSNPQKKKHWNLKEKRLLVVKTNRPNENKIEHPSRKLTIPKKERKIQKEPLKSKRKKEVETYKKRKEKVNNEDKKIQKKNWKKWYLTPFLERIGKTWKRKAKKTNL
jgi:hypothetical protein